MFDYNFGKCGPIRKKMLYGMSQIFPPHLQYVVKVENPKMLLILMASSTNC